MTTIDFDHDPPSPPSAASEWASARRVLARQCPPAQAEAALLRAFARHHAPRPWYRRLSARALVGAGSLAAVGGIGVLMVALMFQPPATVATIAMPQGFFPIVDARHMTLAKHAQLLHAELPRRVLAGLGVPMNDALPEELVAAELIVTETGEPIAVRVAFN